MRKAWQMVLLFLASTITARAAPMRIVATVDGFEPGGRIHIDDMTLLRLAE